MGNASPAAKNTKGERRIERPLPTGYYQTLNLKDKNGERISTTQLENEDRAILTLDGPLTTRKRKAGGVVKKPNGFLTITEPDEKLRGSGLKGVKLRKRLNNRFTDTNIGNSKMGRTTRGIVGKAENLDQYFAAIDDTGKVKNRVQVRDVEQRNQDAIAVALLRSTPGAGEIVKFNDGKPTTLGAFNNPSGGLVGASSARGFTRKRKSKLFT